MVGSRSRNLLGYCQEAPHERQSGPCSDRAVVLAGAGILFAAQCGPGAALPGHYTNEITPLGSVDTAAADRARQTLMPRQARQPR